MPLSSSRTFWTGVTLESDLSLRADAAVAVTASERNFMVLKIQGLEF